MSRHTISVSLQIKSSRESVYALLADHANLDTFNELSNSVLLHPGSPDPNGLGAERQVVIKMFGWLPIRFTEDITTATPPEEFHYLVSKASIMLGPIPLWAGLRHHGGQLRLVAENHGCHVYWTSSIEMLVPVLGNWLGRIFRVEGNRVFLSVLQQVKARVEV